MMSKEFNLASVRLGTPNDLSDAQNLATHWLALATAIPASLSIQLSHDLLVAVTLDVAYSKKDANLQDVLDFLVDPGWDSARQVLFSFNLSNKGFLQKDAAQWLIGFFKKIEHMAEDRAGALLKACHRHWSLPMDALVSSVKKTRRAGACIPVFNADLVAACLNKMGELKDERRAIAERVLCEAQHDGGLRSLPNARRARVKLEDAKSRFENLLEPIERLQIDLVLAAAMKPQEFRVSPILLLGEPGIGKTFLATQLADALGVATEKISAGGAQGGFQLTGSHSTWLAARPGQLFSLLAGGQSASPVIVIDEVDKIRDSPQPVLPVLLDALDAGTAKHFKDEFFEMRFDVSRAIFVLTANSLEDVPPALLSRVEVFHIPAPQSPQRLRIIQDTVKSLRSKTRKRIELDAHSAQSLSERMDIDLRRVTRLVHEAFARALQSGDSMARISEPKSPSRRSIGFQ